MNESKRALGKKFQPSGHLCCYATPLYKSFFVVVAIVVVAIVVVVLPRCVDRVGACFDYDSMDGPYSSKQGVAWLNTTFSIALGVLYVALQLSDYSMWHFALEHRKFDFYVTYLEWKSEQPVLGALMSLLTLLMPYSLYQAVVDGVYRTATLRAPLVRHLLDMANLLSLVGIVYLALVQLPLLETQVVSAARLQMAQQQNLILISGEHQMLLTYYHVVLLALNVVQLLVPILLRVLYPMRKQKQRSIGEWWSDDR
jgi:hypothetical protein